MMEEIRKGRSEKEAWAFFEQLNKSVTLYPESGAAPPRSREAETRRSGSASALLPWGLAAR
ncbi:MAG: hypothetical protein IPO75_13565 [Betaproteobacteria bacterium]|nr:hypothetical protein [Betaproteobacteria bacterium]